MMTMLLLAAAMPSFAASASATSTISVRDAIGDCPAAIGDNSTDDTAAIQCHLDYMYHHYGGGIVYFPPGGYLVGNGGVIVRGGVQIQGDGRQGTEIQSERADSSVVTFDASTCQSGAALSNIGVYGFADPSATTNAVTVGDNCAVNIENDNIWFGNAALYERGNGGVIENCTIWGYHYNVYSQGANSYIRDKLDPPGDLASGTAFYQGSLVAGAPSARNYLEACDLDGDYQFSLQVQDPTGTAITVVESSHFTNAIAVDGGAWTALVGTIAGGSLTVAPDSGNVTLSADYFVDPTQVAGGGSNVYDGGGNVNLAFNPSAACTPNGSCSNVCGTGVDNCGNACTNATGCNSGPYALPPDVAPPALLVSSSSANGTTDVMSAIPGSCPAATGDGTHDDTAAIQCHLDYLQKTFGEGLVYFPAGKFLVGGGGLTAGPGIQIKGAGPSQTILQVNSDSPALSFCPSVSPSGGGASSLSDMTVDGYQDPSATTNAVNVGPNCVVDFSNDVLEFGYAALSDQGTDNMIQDCSIAGYRYGFVSTMGHWFINDTFNALGASGVGFYQQGSTSADNVFEGCSFSGSRFSAQFQDGAVDNIAQNSTFSSPISVEGTWLLELVGDQIDANILNPGNNTVVVADSPPSTPPTPSPRPPSPPPPPPPPPSPAGTIWAQPNEGGLNFGSPQTVGQTGNQVLFADLDGDGLADLIQVKPDGTIFVQLNLGGLSFGDPQTLGQTGNRILFADLDGDGLADLIQLLPDGTVWVQINPGGDPQAIGNVPPRTIGHIEHAGNQLLFADVQGNGRADWIEVASDGTISVRPNEGDLRFGDPQAIGQTGNQVLFGDAQGSGRADLIQVTPGGEIWVQPNQGHLDFGDPQTVGQTGNEVLFANLLGNQYADLIQVVEQ